jgi:hypothetical protein
MRRTIAAVLLLYPRRIRVHHGAELECLLEDLISRDGVSRPSAVTRLALDGIGQRLLSRATQWAVIVTLTGTSLLSLAVSDLASASPHPGVRARVSRLDVRHHRLETPVLVGIVDARSRPRAEIIAP